MAPPPRLKVSEWADTKRVLSAESCAEPGQWITARANYQKGIMDAVNDPLVDEIVMMTSAQVGKTELCNNIIGYFVDQDPSPMLLVQPTLQMAQAWSKDRLAPMLRDTPCLQGKVKDVKTRFSGNTILHKIFPGGHITASGANSPASLASRPVRIVICDEVDRYPVSAGSEGDPVTLAVKRCTTFWNRKKIMTSTPTVKGVSRIEQEWQKSDQRRYYVACPKCGEYQVLVWGQVKWEKIDGKHHPETAYYECQKCRAHLSDADKVRMLRNGIWRGEHETTGIAGFHINELYSPWVPFASIVDNFLKSKDNPETLRAWVNTSLGETWEDAGETIEEDSLLGRREKYGPALPAGAAVLTCGVDVQDDRLECEVKAWGRGEESWGIDYRVFYGNPGQGEIWGQLDEHLKKRWRHPTGAVLPIACTCIDSGGHHTKEVYQFVKPRQLRRVFATKGANQPGSPLISKPRTSNIARVKLFFIGADTAKQSIYARLRIKDPGPGYLHFPMEYDPEYFSQLTAEKIVTKYFKGFARREWVKIRPRNEVLDITVENLAALAILNCDLNKLADRIGSKASPGGDAGTESHVESVQSEPDIDADGERKKAEALNARRESLKRHYRKKWSVKRW